MLTFIKHFVCFILAVVLQTTVASWLGISGQEPDFILIFIVVMALSRGPVAGMLWGFFAGFSADVFSSVDWLGAQTIAFTCVGFAVGQLEERFLRLNLVTKVTLLGLAFMLNDLIFYCIVGIEQEKVLTFFLTNTLPECLYTMVFGVFCFLLLNRIDRATRRNV